GLSQDPGIRRRPRGNSSGEPTQHTTHRHTRRDHRQAHVPPMGHQPGTPRHPRVLRRHAERESGEEPAPLRRESAPRRACHAHAHQSGVAWTGRQLGITPSSPVTTPPMANQEAMADQEVSVRGARLVYELSGEGPDLIWGHGLTMNRSSDAGMGLLDWSQIPVSVVRYDARGHGESESTPDTKGYSWSEL